MKGKKEAVRVYELLEEPSAAARTYEEAFEAYLARDFARARELLRPLADDPPSRVLAARCEAMAASPPPAELGRRLRGQVEIGPRQLPPRPVARSSRDGARASVSSETRPGPRMAIITSTTRYVTSSRPTKS